MQSLKKLATKKLKIRDIQYLPDDIILELAEESLKTTWIIKAANIRIDNYAGDDCIEDTFSVATFVTKAETKQEAIRNFINDNKYKEPVNDGSVIYSIIYMSRYTLSPKLANSFGKYEDKRMKWDEDNLFETFIDENIEEIIALFSGLSFDTLKVLKFEYETTY